MKYTAEDLTDLYAKRGGEIFDRSFWRGVSSAGGLLDEKYGHQALVKLLKEYIGTRKFNEAFLPTLISSYDIERRKPYFFKSWNDSAPQWPMWQVGRATSAAPTFFEPTNPINFRAGIEGHALVYGGVFVNNPALCAYAEARKIFPDADEIFVVSLGTGELTREIPYRDAKDWGLAGWALPILSVVFDGVSDAVDYQLQQILEDDFQRFQCKLKIASDDLDNASAANIEALKMQARNLIEARSDDLDAVCRRLLED